MGKRLENYLYNDWAKYYPKLFQFQKDLLAMISTQFGSQERLHLPDWDSPKQTIFVTNVGYLSAQERNNSNLFNFFNLSDDDLRQIYGDIENPTVPINLSSLAYCGAHLICRPKPYPELLWEAVNYTLPCNLLNYTPDKICWACVAKLDEIRAKTGHGSVIEELKKERSTFEP